MMNGWVVLSQVVEVMEVKDIKQNYPIAERIAQVVSAIFHPLALPAVAFTFLVIADDTSDLSRKLVIEFVAIAFSVIVVPGYIFFLKSKGIIDSADITIREQRINPLSIGAASYFIGFILLKIVGAPNIIQGLMFCYATNTLLVVLITNWWKVSVHTTAISGPLVALAYQFGNVVFPFFALIPLVGVSRFILKRHSFAQIFVGAIIGVLLTAWQIRLLFSSL
jgi:membrane-associated phospholipid phosphatase